MIHSTAMHHFIRTFSLCLNVNCIPRLRFGGLTPEITNNVLQGPLLTPHRTFLRAGATTIRKSGSRCFSHQQTSANCSAVSSTESAQHSSHGFLSPSELLFQLVSPHIASAPCVSRVAHVYSTIPKSFDEVVSNRHLPPSVVEHDTRRWLRNQFGTLSSALRQLHVTNSTEHWGIYISQDHVYVVKAYSEEEAEEAFATFNAVTHTCDEKFGEPSIDCTSRQRTSLCERESLLEVFQPVFPNFTPPPLPPPSQRQRSFAGKRKKHVPDGVFTPQMLVPYVPTFFVPMSELLQELPEGYTAEHIEGLFAATGTLEIVELEGEKFVRLHGGNRFLDFTLDGAGIAAHERWRAYQPDPFLCQSFCRIMSTSAHWVSLRVLIMRSPTALVEALLPLRGYKTLLFFAQMQHVFCFTPRGEGEVCRAASVTCLSYRDSPTPAVVSELVGLLSGQRAYITDLQRCDKYNNSGCICISDHAKTQIIMYYGTLINFFRVHGEVFYVEEDSLVGLISDRKITTNTTKTLEDKLEDALMKKDRRTAQKVRRRMSLERNPDSPYTDREVLLDAILRYLPRNRSISLNFLLRSLPLSLSDFLPNKPLALFQQAPEKVRIFEYRYRHRLHLIRPGVPLPPGVLRDTYTEQELLFLCAAELQQQPRFAVDVYGRLPYGAKEVIRLQYKGLLELLKPHPQYFTVVFKDSLRMDSRQALVTLIQMPPSVGLTEDDYGAHVPDDAVLQQLEAEDRDALEALPDEVRKTIRQGNT
ncbi:uncharacterized protein TEOVI_000724300 [Trypanosoma equiperdum]|uniref:Uncharacterized protein n=1 Tax=Trypanosoma equiperdum TaxID=5694 RepID=A0A1G4I6L0_TRYEQ|nr:hypothetical protein, conserved [Trypanosoma equiperdum]